MRPSSLTKRAESGSILRVRIASVDAGVSLYYVAFFIYSSVVYATHTSWMLSGLDIVGKMVVPLKMVAFMLLALKILLFQRQTMTQWIVFGAVLLLCIASFKITGDPVLLAFALLIFAGKGICIKRLAQIALGLNVALLVCAVFGSRLGLLVDFVITRDGGELRHSLGFNYPNAFGVCIASICIALFTVRGNVMRKRHVLVGLISCVLIDRVADSRTAIASTLFAVLIYYIHSNIRTVRYRNLFYRILSLLAIGVVGFSYFAMMTYDPTNEIYYQLNSHLSGRLRWANYYFLNYPPGILGQDTSTLPVISFNDGATLTTFVVDNAFARLYLRFGPLLTIILVAVIIRLLWKRPSSNEDAVVWVGFVSAIVYGFAESSFLYPEFNIFMIIGVCRLLNGDVCNIGFNNKLWRGNYYHFPGFGYKSDRTVSREQLTEPSIR